MQHGVFDQRRDRWVLQPTRTKPTVEAFVCLSEVLRQLGEHFGDSAREAVEKPKCHELDRLGRVEVREVTSRVPAPWRHSSLLSPLLRILASHERARTRAVRKKKTPANSAGTGSTCR